MMLRDESSGMPPVYSGGQNADLRITFCSWDRLAVVREAGRRTVLRYGAALERLSRS